MWMWLIPLIIAVGMFVASSYGKIRIAAPKEGCSQCPKKAALMSS